MAGPPALCSARRGPGGCGDVSAMPITCAGAPRRQYYAICSCSGAIVCGPSASDHTIYVGSCLAERALMDETMQIAATSESRPATGRSLLAACLLLVLAPLAGCS